MLSAQKMEGMLCQWSLAIQEYDFKIVYRKGSSHSKADALSRCFTELCAITIGLPHYSSARWASTSIPNFNRLILL